MLANRYSYRIAWGDCDSAGIVYYPNFYRWFDRGTHELVRDAGFSVKELRLAGRDIPLVETGCIYRAPGYFDDVVEVQTEIAEVREKVFRIEHRCLRDGLLLCEGFEVRAYADITNPAALRAVPLPPEMALALRAETAAGRESQGS